MIAPRDRADRKRKSNEAKRSGAAVVAAARMASGRAKRARLVKVIDDGLLVIGRPDEAQLQAQHPERGA